MENESWEIYLFFFLGWLCSGFICILTLTTYWFGYLVDGWKFELTLLLVIDFGILGVLIIITLISVFLHRFSIVSKERLEELIKKK